MNNILFVFTLIIDNDPSILTVYENATYKRHSKLDNRDCVIKDIDYFAFEKIIKFMNRNNGHIKKIRKYVLSKKLNGCTHFIIHNACNELHISDHMRYYLDDLTNDVIQILMDLVRRHELTNEYRM
jgi:hypothetical protein